MQLAELVSKLLSGVSFVNYNSLLLIASQVDVNK